MAFCDGCSFGECNFSLYPCKICIHNDGYRPHPVNKLGGKNMDVTKTEHEIVQHYSSDYLTTVATEECAELIQAITKCKRYGCADERRENLTEEMADVMIVMDELMLIYDIDLSDVYQIIERKLERQKLRMAHGDK